MSEVKDYIVRNFGNKIYFGTPRTAISSAGEIRLDFSNENVCSNLITSLVIQPRNVGGLNTFKDLDNNKNIMQLFNSFSQPLYMPFDYLTLGPSIKLKFDTVDILFSIVYENLYSRTNEKIKIEDLLHGKF